MSGAKTDQTGIRERAGPSYAQSMVDIPSSGSSNLPPRHLKVSWRTIAVISLALAIAAVTGLVVVAAIHRASALSTVALALAIVAFSSQLMVALVQNNAATAQVRRSEEIATNTLTTLAAIRTTSEQILSRVTPQGDSDVPKEELLPSLPQPPSSAGPQTATEDEERATDTDARPDARNDDEHG
jgi:hypothetical protein